MVFGLSVESRSLETGSREGLWVMKSLRSPEYILLLVNWCFAFLPRCGLCYMDGLDHDVLGLRLIDSTSYGEH